MLYVYYIQSTYHERVCLNYIQIFEIIGECKVILGDVIPFKLIVLV